MVLSRINCNDLWEHRIGGFHRTIGRLNSMSGTYEYLAELQLNDGTLVQVDLEERGWADPDRLAITRVFTLVPKPDNKNPRWPLVKIHIPEGGKPIFKSRNNVLLTAGQSFRTYAVGWFKDGESHWTWVLPNGAIESGTDEPTFSEIMTKAANQTWREAQNLPR